jgi:hypothetical protein
MPPGINAEAAWAKTCAKTCAKNGGHRPCAMLAVLGGVLALLLGLTVLLLPVLATELSRPRDSVWGAVVLLLGLVLVTSSDRLTGAPMLGVLCGGLLIGRLGLEVGQGRWRQLSPEEQQRLWSQERWQSSLQELAATLARLVAVSGGAVGGLGRWIAERRRPRSSSKRWVRQDSPDTSQPMDTTVTAITPQVQEQPAEAQPQPAGEEAAVEVTSLDGVDQLLRNAPAPAEAPAQAEAPESAEPPEPAVSAEPAPLHIREEPSEAGAPEDPSPPRAEAG